ncbi:MAG: outer membrane beta-barrel protein [Bacteroidia bacterium]
MPKSLLIVFLLCLSAFQAAFAQSTLTGTVQGVGADPVPDATVYLLDAADSSLLRSALTDAQGNFELTNAPADTVLLAIRHVEFKAYMGTAIVIKPGEAAKQIPAIQMQPLGDTKLQTVDIVAKLPLVEQKIDRTVVNVDAMISAAGGTAMDALERSPGVKVDQNGNISLKGKTGVVVFIDDKPTYLSGDDLANYLRSLPASTLKSIEIMTNPPAKYDAAGNAGILNIKTKKNNVEGFNGAFSVNYGQGRLPKSNNSLSLNYRHNKLNISSNFGGGYRTGFQDLFISRAYYQGFGMPSSYFRQRSYIEKRIPMGNGKVSVDYYASEKTTIGVVLTSGASLRNEHTDNVARVLDGDEVPLSRVTADNTIEALWRNAGANLNLRHTFDSLGRTLTVDADIIRYANDEQHLFKNTVMHPMGDTTYTDQLNGTLPSDIRIVAFKSDYEHPFRNGLKISSGIKASFTHTDNAVEYIRTVGAVSEVDNTISNHFIYDERILAAYVNASREWKRFGAQIGLRGESTRSFGNQLGNEWQPASTFNRKYDNLFPTAFLSYKLDSAANHQLNFSYGKRIDRPFFQDLNPFLSPLDKFTFYSGNPYLKPSFAQNLSLTYTYKGMASVSLNYGQSRGEINETLEIINRIYYSRPGNIGSSEIINISANAQIPVTKWWTANLYAESGRTHYVSKLYNQKLDASGIYGFGQFTNLFQFGKGWSGEFSGEYMSQFVSAQVTTQGVGFLTLGAKKLVLKDKGAIKLSISDVLYTRHFRGIINNLQNTIASYHSPIDSRVIAATFSYRFGKNLGEQRRHEGGSADSGEGQGEKLRI